MCCSKESPCQKLKIITITGCLFRLSKRRLHDPVYQSRADWSAQKNNWLLDPHESLEMFCEHPGILNNMNSSEMIFVFCFKYFCH